LINSCLLRHCRLLLYTNINCNSILCPFIIKAYGIFWD